MQIELRLFVFLIGATLFGVTATKDGSANFLIKIGGVFWVASYFSIVIDNWIRKADVSTRNGIVRYEKEPIMYFLSYVLVFSFGAIALIFIIFAAIVS